MLPGGLQRLVALLDEYECGIHLAEREVLAFLPDDVLWVLTPHSDFFEERRSSYSRVWVRGPRGGLPARYFRPGKGVKAVLFNDANRHTSMDDVADEWRQISPRHGWLEASGASDAGEVADAQLAPAAGVPARGTEAPHDAGHSFRHPAAARDPGAHQPHLGHLFVSVRQPQLEQNQQEQGRLWIFIESSQGYDAGPPVTPRLSRVLSTPAGRMAIRPADTWTSPAYSVGDIRELPSRYDPQGQRFRTVTSSGVELSEDGFAECRITGPSTTLWLAKSVTSQDATSARRLAATCEGVAVHMFISKLLDTALCYDCLNLGELLCMEWAGQMHQYGHYRSKQHYQESLRAAGELIPSPAEAGQANETVLFLGHDHSIAMAEVGRALSEHDSGRIKDESAVHRQEHSMVPG